MSKILSLLTLSLSLLIALNTACGPTPSNTAANENKVDRSSDAVQTNPEELSLLIRLPLESEDIDDLAWKMNAETKAITAVFRLTPEGIKKADTSLFSQGSTGATAVDVKPWFPEELRAQSEQNGDIDLQGKEFSISEFAQPPYTKGRVVRIDATDYFVIEISPS